MGGGEGGGPGGVDVAASCNTKALRCAKGLSVWWPLTDTSPSEADRVLCMLA